MLRQRDRIAFWLTIVLVVALVFEGMGAELLRFLAYPLFIGMALTVAVIPARLGLGLILEERQSGTLGDLFLAGVTPGDFFLSKAAVAAGMLASLMVGLLPALALPFLTGGLSFGTFAGMIILLPALGFASLGISLLISTLARTEASAFGAAVVVGVGWSTAIPLWFWMGRLVTGVPPFSERWLTLTPLYPVMLAKDGLNALTYSAFWQSVGVLVTVGIGCFLAAAAVLPGKWKRDLVNDGCRQAVRRSGQPPAPAPVTDPISGLLRREQSKLRWYRGLLLLLAMLWTAGILWWGKAWLHPIISLGLLLLLFMVTSTTETLLLIAGVGRLRRDGAFEELVVTPLHAAEIVDGFLNGYAGMFHPVRRWTLALAGAVFCGGLTARTWSLGALVSYAVLGGLLIASIRFSRANENFAAFRLALLTGSTALSYAKVGGLNWGLLAGQSFNLFRLFNYLRGMGSLPEFPSGSTLEVALVLLGGLVVGLMAVGMRHPEGRHLAVDELRRLVSEPLARRRDPRFVRWKAREATPNLS